MDARSFWSELSYGRTVPNCRKTSFLKTLIYFKDSRNKNDNMRIIKMKNLMIDKIK